MARRALPAMLGIALLGFAADAAAGSAASPVAPVAPAPAPTAGRADPLSVSVMTFGPGDDPFNRFGHDALWIRDRQAGTDLVYNFGTFRFDSPRLIFDFLGGRLDYWLSVSSLPVVLDDYQAENRSIVIQELALPPQAKLLLQARLRENARPENRSYKYDYFLDNCATRVRDAVDRVAGSAVHRAARAPGRMTLRQHALRMTAKPLWFYLALDIVLGPEVDRPIDRWGEMFLPEELQAGLASATLPDGRPLVGSTTVAFRADRPPPQAWPPDRRPSFFLAGLAFALVLGGLGWFSSGVAARVLLGVLVSIWGLLVGSIGCFLIYAWLFTDHVVAHRNQNILLCAPWAVALAVLGIGVALGRPGAVRKAYLLGLLAVAAVLSALTVKLGLAPHQENGALIAFFLPAWLGVLAGLGLLHHALVVRLYHPRLDS